MTPKQILGCTPEQISRLKAADIPALVTAAIDLDRELKDKQKQLSNLKDRLKYQAEQDLRDEGIKDLPGCSCEFKGECGNVAQISFAKPGLVRGFFLRGDEAQTYRDEELVKLGPVKTIAGKWFDRLFMRSYKPAKAFRELALGMLGEKDGPKLIKMLEEAGTVRVGFKTADGKSLA